jgi:RNA polymerase sigma-70 factor (ECF subfamily)
MDFEGRLNTVYADALRFARALAGSTSDGDDVLQDALVKAWRGYPKLRDKDAFRPWLLKIISNTYRSWVRRRKLKSWLSLDVVRNMPAEPEPTLEHRDLLRRALATLPREQKEALSLFELTGASQEEIAEIQGVSLSAVKSRVSRGRKQLRKRLLLLERKGEQHVG